MIEKQDTKSRILDAAEKLFGLNGFEATSLRDITAEAQVNLAAVNYHFQSKDSLIDAVLARRIEPVNRRRFEMLDAAGPSPTLEQILEAFMLPVLDQDLSSVVPLMGRMMSDPTQFVERVFKKYFGPVSQRIREELHKQLPDLPLSEIFWRTHFLAGIMTHIMSWSQVLPDLTEGLCSIADRKAVIGRIVAFAAAGFRAAAPEPVVSQPVAMERKG
jgi:AcrR family transcriptional regulator